MLKAAFLILGLFLFGVDASGHSSNCGPPPNNKNPNECCVLPMPVEESVIQKCAKEFGSKKLPEGQEGQPQGCCVAECIVNASGLASNGNFNAPALKKALKANTKNADWNAVIDTVVDSCIEKANRKAIELQPTMPPAKPGEHVCSLKYGIAMKCFLKNLFKNCPDSVFNSDAECNALKVYAETCPINPLKSD